MEITLMLQNEPVLIYETDDINKATKITKVISNHHLPFPLINNATEETLNSWLKRRAIPDTRENLKETTEQFGDKWQTNPHKASLTDPYWLKVAEKDTWNKVNFFTRKYSQDIGDIFFTPWSFSKDKISTDSPDLTTNGVLMKRWRQKENLDSYLIKQGSKITHQEPLSEILVSVILEQLNFISFVRYDYTVEGISLCSKCDNFVTEDFELVPAAYIYLYKKKDDSCSVVKHLLNMCEQFQIEDAKEYIEKMLFIDALVANNDRNLSNISFLRNIHSNELIPAPLFDFAASYWSRSKIDKSSKSKCFSDVEKEIFDRYKKDVDLDSFFKEIAYKDCIETYPNISTDKKKALITAITERTKELCLDRCIFPEL